MSSSTRLCILMTVAASFLTAADPSLNALTATLIPMRSQDLNSPQLAVAKHQLRGWVESRLSTLPQSGDEAHLAYKLNAELQAAGLTCGADTCPVVNLLGFTEEISLTRVDSFLLLKTGLGIECGHDESAYLYRWNPDGWSLFWHSEQEQKPQYIERVLVARQEAANDYLILTLGHLPWCTSSWHDVYFRVFRPGSTVAPKPILDGEEYAWLGREMNGSITKDSVLIEYAVASLDPGLHNRTVVRKYALRGNRIERIDPVALSPREFVEEWLARDWTEAAARTEAPNRRKLQSTHSELKGTGEFNATRHCPATPDLWQVDITFERAKSPTYFLVRWRPPYTFRLVNITQKPNVGCTEPDRAADAEQLSLFPPQ